jgi:hypothetical protein
VHVPEPAAIKRPALFSRSAICGVAGLAYAVLTDDAMSRSFVLGLVVAGGLILVYSLVSALRARQFGKAITALILVCAAVALPFIPIWQRAGVVVSRPGHTLFFKQERLDFE